MNRIYADFNATTPMGVACQKGLELGIRVWGNPSSTHADGRQANEIIEESRRLVASALQVSPTEVVFTSGGSEANTMALLGSYFLNPKDFRLLTTSVEHSSVRDTAQFLEKQGVPVEYVPVRSDGSLDLETFKSHLQRFRPTLVSVMAANNETGVIFPLKEIYSLCREQKTYLHTDAVQTLGKLNPSQWNFCDLVSVTGHKVFGPKGVGALVVRKGVPLMATHFGGAQEIKRRGGTENVLGILGFGNACTELPTGQKMEEISQLRDRLERGLLKALPGVTVNGAGVSRIANTSSIRFEGIPSEALLGALDLDGISVSAGSACSSGSLTPSHVLLAMGFTKQAAKECLRFSWGKTTTLEEIDTVLRFVIKHVNRIRERKQKTA